MLAKRKFFQVGLILTAIFVIFFTYFFKSVDVKQNIEEKQEIVKEDFSEEEINKFENVEYQGVDNSGNKFVIGSEFAQFEQERPEIINMEVLKCTFYFKDNTFLTIIADKGVFNNITNDMKFTDNVKMNYLENVLFSDRAIFNNYENQMLVAGNVKGENPQSKLEADELDFDLNTKNLKISMYSKERVNIKTKF